MSKYQRVIAALNENELSWDDVDRIELSEAAYDEFVERASFNPSNYATTDAPAVRYTEGQEKLVYVDENGHLQEIVL